MSPYWGGIRKPAPEPKKVKDEIQAVVDEALAQPAPEPRQLYDAFGAPISNPPDDAA